MGQDRASGVARDGHGAAGASSSAADQAPARSVGSGTVQRKERREERDDERRDRRDGREADRDRRERRPEGGRDRARAALGDLDSDWAGRAILERYLFGEGDWDVHDARWTEYLMRSEILRKQLAPHLHKVATVRGQIDPGADTVALPFTESFHAAVENGEGIIGYQYLHGTNGTVGDFLLRGTATVTRGIGGMSNPDGTTEAGGTVVTVEGHYRWNDLIDPNPIYQTDRVKSAIAETISLGQAQAYRISINWTATTRAHLDARGQVIRLEGWPGT